MVVATSDASIKVTVTRCSLVSNAASGPLLYSLNVWFTTFESSWLRY